MTFKQINDWCFYDHSSVNIGYIHKGSTGLLIDSGIDRSSVKKVLKELEKQQLPLTHLFITHAHADHYGGASYVQNAYDVHTSAPVLEESVLSNPSLEPVYLFNGVAPLNELRNKFLEGPPVRIDRVVDEGQVDFGDITAELFLLPGHSHHQLALKAGDILYAADSYFSLETLQKHRIPFLVDAGEAIHSLERLLAIPSAGTVPGHGSFETDPSETIRQNIVYHQRILDAVQSAVEAGGEVTHEELISILCTKWDVQAPALGQWLLYRTAVTAYAVTLKKAEVIQDRLVDHKWVFSAISR
ncbi:MBL fold metallo-hydrolase [Halobacillus kuroshimensis]|uniref:MBL fold metallo-hydrolase n=1 Tax=Halobacillus kuroshimensis TaxID=302481 RepID=A0ABS3DQY2_9BACI|nr:MBL fold metallo-hydrolase [Halobacillus kuroshimensis]MBN8233748.1 MBL fold metallo-hydrolase [Halobacillus kuroshimensis]